MNISYSQHSIPEGETESEFEIVQLPVMFKL